MIYYRFKISSEKSHKDKKNLLHKAVAENNEQMIDFLLMNNEDINEQDNNGDTPLHIAYRNEYKNVVNTLLSYDADFTILNNEGISVLHMILDFTESQKSSVPSHKENILHWLVEKDNLQGVKEYIEDGGDINTQDNSGNTALHLACYRFNINMISHLLCMQIDTKLKNKGNYTAFDILRARLLEDIHLAHLMFYPDDMEYFEETDHEL